MTPRAVRLDATPIHLGSPRSAQVLTDFSFAGAGFDAYVERHCSSDDPGRLVMLEHSKADWPIWECHPAGDEVVIVLAGRAELIQEVDGVERRTTLKPGDAIINPAGVWHTANVIEPLSAVYITPCPGTLHRPRPQTPACARRSAVDGQG